MKKSIYKCPYCQEILMQDEKICKCSNNHSYDKSKSGYVNLMLVTDKNSKLPGDNKIMVNARQNFLEKGYYKPLVDKISEVLLKYVHNNTIIVDAGCGEGYYTSILKNKLTESSIKSKMIGVDISKIAVDKAAKNDNNIEWAVGSVFHMPIVDDICDIVINIFAPFALDEYSRILNKSGKIIMVIPAENHLFELKEKIYSNPLKNEVKDYELLKYNFMEKIDIDYNIEFDNNEDIKNLFTMTPYYYKTSKEDKERLDKIQNLKTQISFQILVYEKI